MTRPLAALCVLIVLSTCDRAAGPTESPGPTPVTGTASAAATPGSPLTGDEVLELMRMSRRPGGVPAQLQTPAIANAIAERLVSYDGEPWGAVTVGGTCPDDASGGASTAACSLEVAATSPDDAGADIYVFAVNPGGGVTVREADLHGYPAVLDRELMAIVSDQVPEAAEMLFVGARWDVERPNVFHVDYRAASGEGGRGLEVVVDLSAGEVLDVRSIGV